MNLSLEEVSQFAHVGWGYLFVTFPFLILRVPLYITVPIVVAAAAAKEYADCHGLENEQTSGGTTGSWEDFIFWCLGVVIAVAAIR